MDDQFIEQAPGPRGSPQLPQAPPPPEGIHPPDADTPKAENCFSNFVAWHWGQTALVDPWTNSSKR
jgi:hypothetical protein